MVGFLVIFINLFPSEACSPQRMTLYAVPKVVWLHQLAPMSYVSGLPMSPIGLTVGVFPTATCICSHIYACEQLVLQSLTFLASVTVSCSTVVNLVCGAVSVVDGQSFVLMCFPYTDLVPSAHFGLKTSVLLCGLY